MRGKLVQSLTALGQKSDEARGHKANQERLSVRLSILLILSISAVCYGLGYAVFLGVRHLLAI